MPTRRTNVPCYTIILDMECIAQLFVSYADKRKDTASRNSYNDWVWNRVLKRKCMDKKFAKN